MSETTSTEMSEEFKAALKKKEEEEARRKEEERLKQVKQRHSVAKARREAAAKKRQMQIDALTEKTKVYEAQIEKAGKTLENESTYSLLGKILRWFFVFFLILTLVLAFTGFSRDTITIMLIVALFILATSVFCQFIPIRAENEQRQAARKLKKTRLEILEIKSRHK